jgi:imidazolonepropionase-like amidohydrolase
MPGLIDAHWHAFMAAAPQEVLITAEPSYLHLLAARQAEATLMRGFTTIRDLGGPVFGLKRAIDEGVMVGPRIYPLENLNLVADPSKSFLIIMKDGRIYKNALPK